MKKKTKSILKIVFVVVFALLSLFSLVWLLFFNKVGVKVLDFISTFQLVLVCSYGFYKVFSNTYKVLKYAKKENKKK